MANINRKPIFTYANVYYLGKTAEGIVKMNSTEANQGRLIVRVQMPHPPSLPTSVNGWTDYFVFEDLIDIANATDTSVAALQRADDSTLPEILRRNLQHVWSVVGANNRYMNTSNNIANYLTVMGIVCPSKKSSSEIDFNTGGEVIQQTGLVSDHVQNGLCDSFRIKADHFADANKIGYAYLANTLSKLNKPNVLSDFEYTDAYEHAQMQYLYLVVYKDTTDGKVLLNYMYVLMKTEWGEIGNKIRNLDQSHSLSVIRIGMVVPNDMGAPYKKNGFDIILQNLYMSPGSKWLTYSIIDMKYKTPDAIKGQFWDIPDDDYSLRNLICQ